MVIVCWCEGPLGPPHGDVVHCTRCPRTYPAKETVQILKLLQLSARETNNDGTPANEHVRHQALNKAAKKMAVLKLKAIDETEFRPSPQPPPQPTYRPPVPTYGSTTNTTATGYYGTSMGYVDINFGGFIFRVRGYTV